MKKISFIIITIILATISIAFAFGNNKNYYSDKKGYELYEERVSDYCDQYKNTDKNTELFLRIDTKDSFPNLNETLQTGNDLEIAKKQYKENMDKIYSCATTISYYRSLETIKNDLINKNADLNGKLKRKITEKQKQLEQNQKKITNGQCKIKNENKNSIIKKSVLEQTTYQLCNYNFYLEYLKEQNRNIKHLIEEENKVFDRNNSGNYKSEDGYYTFDSYESKLSDPNNSIAINKIIELENNKLNQIENEIENSYKVFPIALKAYSDYENNIAIHTYLELLKEDYIILRESLHKSLNPINQVVYKISNAMKP